MLRIFYDLFFPRLSWVASIPDWRTKACEFTVVYHGFCVDRTVDIFFSDFLFYFGNLITVLNRGDDRHSRLCDFMFFLFFYQVVAFDVNTDNFDTSVSFTLPLPATAQVLITTNKREYNSFKNQCYKIARARLV